MIRRQRMGGGFLVTLDLLIGRCVVKSIRTWSDFVIFEARGIKISQNSLRSQQSIFPKLVQFLRKIYHSTRLDERFSNLFSDRKNLGAFESYVQNTDFIVTRQISNSDRALWNQYFGHNLRTPQDFLDLKADLKSARRDASNGISYEGIGPTLRKSIFEVVGSCSFFPPRNPKRFYHISKICRMNRGQKWRR